MAELRADLATSLGAAYTIERELGGGGMSRVFVAEDTTLGRHVVVKVLPPDLASGVSIERFKREIVLAARLQESVPDPKFGHPGTEAHQQMACIVVLNILDPVRH